MRGAMRSRALCPALSGLVLILGGCLEAPRESSGAAQEPAAQHHELAYLGEGGASAWGAQSPLCDIDREASQQSPIAIDPTATADCGSAGGLTEIDYGLSEVMLGHNGHTLIVDVLRRDGEGGPTNRIVVDGVAYELDQFHVHTPSEHVVGGREWPLEVHLVHRAADGRLAVVGVLAEVASNEDCTSCADAPIVDALLEELPIAEPGSHEPSGLRAFPGLVSPDALLPAAGSRAGFLYEGSLTTPACTEGVKWTVLETPVVISARQLDAIRARLESDAGLLEDGSPRLPFGFNARRHTDPGRASPLPPANGRVPRGCPGPVPAWPEAE